MKLKKIAAAIFSLLTVAGSSVVYAAEDPSAYPWTTVVNAICRLPVISVTVPSTGTVYINPFQIPVQIGDEYSDEQILSSPTLITNASEVPVSVDVSVIGTINVGSNMTLSSTTTKGTNSTSKKAFIYFEMKAVNDYDLDYVPWDKAYDEEKHVVVRTTEKKKKKVVTLEEWNEDGERNCFGAFRITGDCVAYPKNEWNSSDGLKVQVAFTFTPLAFY